MADLTKPSKPQMSFLNDRETYPCLFVTTQKNLLSFLSSGMITPSACQFRYRSDSRDLAAGALPFWKGGLPDDAKIDELTNDPRSVIIEFSWDDLQRYAGRNAAYESNHVIVLFAPLPMALATALHLPTQDAIDDFLLRVTDDVIYDRSMFNVAPTFEKLTGSLESQIVAPVDIAAEITAIDRFAGGINAVRHYPGELTGEDINYVVSPILAFLKISTDASVKWTGQETQLSSADQLLLAALIPLLNEFKEENGYDPLELLRKLEENLRNATGAVPDELVKWASYVKAVINAEKEIKPLRDKGDIIQRAALLFLLRPQLDRLLSARESSVDPGPKVLLVAIFFAGCAAGVTRMGAEFKGDFRSYTKSVKSFIDALWKKSILNVKLLKGSAGSNDSLASFEVNGEVLFEIAAKQDPVLARVLHQARSLGFNLQYDMDNDELVYEAIIDSGQRQIVKIERVQAPSFNSLEVIKFSSSCVPLSLSKMRGLKKDQLLDLLFRNAGDGMYCAFALSEKRKAVVVEATQILKTMDDDEFVMLLNHVANTAASYS